MNEGHGPGAMGRAARSVPKLRGGAPVVAAISSALGGFGGTLDLLW